MPDIIPAPEGLWAIVAIYPDTETVAFRGGHAVEFNAGEPELGISPVIGFERDSDNAFYPLILHSDGSFAEILPSNAPPYSFEAYVLTNGSPFIPCGLGKSAFTLDTLPEKYRHLLDGASNPSSNYAAPGRYTYARCEDGDTRRITQLMTEEAALSHQRLRNQFVASVLLGQAVLRALESHPEGLTEEQLAALTYLDIEVVRTEVNQFIDHAVVSITDGLVTVTDKYLRTATAGEIERLLEENDGEMSEADIASRLSALRRPYLASALRAMESKGTVHTDGTVARLTDTGKDNL